jgi:hypothetical protein
MRWVALVALLVSLTTNVSAKKIIPVRPEARRQLLDFNKLKDAKLLPKVMCFSFLQWYKVGFSTLQFLIRKSCAMRLL